MKYSNMIEENTSARGEKIKRDWKREAGHQPGMVLDVLNLDKKIIPGKEKAA